MIRTEEQKEKQRSDRKRECLMTIKHESDTGGGTGRGKHVSVCKRGCLDAYLSSCACVWIDHDSDRK